MVSFLGSVVMPAGQSSMIAEPTGAQAGRIALVAGNWFLARSVDGGITWTFTDPAADMTDYCCDQEVLYDAARHMFLWYRQAVGDAAGRNRFVLSGSTDGGVNWCSYSVQPSQMNRTWTVNQAFDYPRLALSNNNVYVVSGMSGRGAPESAVLRFPLDQMAACEGLSVLWWGQLSYWASPVQGATTTMYFGDHRATSNTFRIYEQPEKTSGLVWRDVTIPAWQLEQGATCPLDAAQNCCPSADGSQWCGRSDSMVRAGWIARGLVSFMWNARQGNGFPYPYVEGATFELHKNFAYVARPLLWSSAGAWHYPFIAPNARGDIGGAAFFSSPRSFPSPYFLVFDDYSPAPPGISVLAPGLIPWENYRLFAGTAGSAGWGDYVRVRAFQPSQLGWTAMVYTIQPGGPEPLFYVLARQRDLQSLENWFRK
jgi:hypothetical protein